MTVGKLPPDLLEAFVLGRTGAADDRVLQGPAYGEDTAAIRLDDGEGEGEGGVLVVNSDPISLAVERIGTLAVNVACNDVAASGATPAFLTVVAFLPDPSEAAVDEVTRQLDAEARRRDVAIVGGHTETAPALSTPLLVVTCFGLTDRYVPTAGARPGDRILVTKGAGVEATAILATDFRERLADRVPAWALAAGEACFDDVGVVEEAALVAPDATAMHDPTEGGLFDGFLELAVASGVGLDVDARSIPVREETARLCRAAGVDPLRTFGSGALLATVPGAALDAVGDRLRDAGVEFAVVGTVREAGAEPFLSLSGERFTEPIRDEMYALWE